MKRCLKKGIYIAAVFIVIMSGCGKQESENKEDTVAQMDKIGGHGIVTTDRIKQSVGTDVVLVMDESGSMVHADEERMAIEGAKLFLDMGRMQESEAALVEFSNEIHSTGLIDMSQRQNREHVKEILDGVCYSRTAHTDTGAGLLEAVSLLEQDKDDKDKIIVLFTDGKTDIDAGTPERTIEDSLEDVNRAVEQAKAKGYKIYCLGLNANGQVDEQELAKIAESTGGKYHIVEDGKELPYFFHSIFADMEQSEQQILEEYDADGNSNRIKFRVDNGNVMEANIIISSGKQLETVSVIDPEGKILDLERNDSAVCSVSAKYTLIKLLFPAAGEWTVVIDGEEGDHIQVGMVYSYDVEIIVEAEQTSISKGEDLPIIAYLTTQSGKITEKGIYQNLTASLSVKDMQSGEIFTQELLTDADNVLIRGTFTAKEETEYQISVHVEGNGFFRDSESFSITVMQNPVRMIKEEAEITLKSGKEKTIALENYFEVTEGEKVSYSIQKVTEGVRAELREDEAVVLMDKPGSGSFLICAQNGAAKQAELLVILQCEDAAQSYKMCGIAAVLILLLGVVVLLYRRMRERIEGQFLLAIVHNQQDEYGNYASPQRFQSAYAIPASKAGRHCFSK